MAAPLIHFPGYQIIGMVGTTIYSSVFRARREGEAETVIIKALRTFRPSPVEKARLRHEYEVIRNLRLEGVVSVREILETPEGIALVLEDFDGVPLKSFIKPTGLPTDQFLAFAVRLADILGQVHLKNIVHRDIKPDNILVHPGSGELKLTDFGIAAEVRELYLPGVIEGTLAYISPEQTGRINRPVDYRSDLYSLGITFYEMLTGRVPFLSPDPMEIIHSHIARSPIPPERLNPQIPSILSAIVLKLMAKIPEERYQNAFGLKADLEICREQFLRSGSIGHFDLGRKDQTIRFALPQALFGRDAEREILYQAFERVVEGSVEVVLVSGESGIGKSSLLKEVQKPIVEKRGYFISGKYDTLQQEVPYRGLKQAIGDLIRQIVRESEGRVRHWREKLLWALEGNGRVLTEVFPELELLIGPQPEIPTLDPKEARNRFLRVFSHLVQVFAEPDHPLVVFLEDLHLADSSSLDLLQGLLGDRELRSLLLLGTLRRDLEASPSLITSTVESWKKKKVPVRMISLGPLDEDAVSQMLSLALHLPKEKIQPLAAVSLVKTKGNPFFLREFLKTVYEEGCLVYDPLTGWDYDLEKIRELKVTENVVQFLVDRIRDLTPPALQMLCIGACLGDAFRVSLAATLAEQPLLDAVKHLGVLEEEGLLFYKEERFRFVHNRIREAAYAILSSQDREAFHYRAGKSALEEWKEEGPADQLFFITDQMNLGRSRLTAREEKKVLAELNLKAGRKAKEATAYPEAVNYLTRGLELLEQDSWIKDYPLTSALHLELLECRYLNRDFEGAQALFRIILRRCSLPLDRAKAYQIMIILYTNMGLARKALSLGYRGLAELGVPFPRRIGRPAVKKALLKIRDLLKDTPAEGILNQPRLNDPKLLAVHELYTHMGTPLYYLNPNLFALLVIRAAQTALEIGHPPQSALSFLSLATLLESFFEDYELAFTLGELALKLNDRLDNRKTAARVHHTYAFFIQHWKRHLRFDVESFFRVYELAVQHGDFLYAGLGLTTAFQLKARLDQHLDQILAEMKTYRNFIRQINDPLISTHFFFQIRSLQHLKGEEKPENSLTGDDPALSFFIDWCRKEKNLFALSLTLFAKTLLWMNDGRWEEAYRTAVELERIIHVPMGSIVVADHYFNYSRILCQLLRQGEEKRKKEFLRLLRRNQEKLQRWSDLCPENFRHRADFIRAELNALEGKHWEALRGYRQAIEGAKNNGFLEDEALFCEQTANFYEQAGLESEARALIARAHECYLRWGALGRSKALEARYPALAYKTALDSHTLETESTSTQTATLSASLDLSAFLEASQTIFSEIVLDRLLEKVMRIALVNAGAQRGFLILQRDGRLSIEAYQDLEKGETQVRISLPLEEGTDLSLPMVHFVFRSGENLILGDASAEGPFIHDPYVRKNRIRSVLCTPIVYQGRISGILYLENNLTAQAFTPERLELLRIIAAQAAISIENARLFELATTDGLTRLYVRRYFHLLLDQEMERALRHGSIFSLIMIDIDNFKKVNDTYGHLLGDEVLRRVAQIIKKNSRAVDIAARYGGEEFVLLLPETNDRGAVIAAEKIRRAVERMELPHEGDLVRVTISLGVGLFPTLAQDKTSLIHCADQALYAAKRAGKNRVILGEPLKEGAGDAGSPPADETTVAP